MAEIDCPYVGLVPFTQAEARFFFGREREKRLIVANLFASRLTLLYGASGVGKSSVLRAGVVHEIERRAERAVEDGGAPEQVIVYVNNWQGDVLARLREAVRRAVVRAFPTAELAALSGEASLAEGIREATEQQEIDLFVICDQFEEYFLYHGDDDGASGGFARQLAEAVNRPGLAASFLLALRDDALSRLDRFKVLIPNLFANYLRLDPLSAEAAEAAIVQPVRVYNRLLPEDSEPVEIEPALIGEVIDQVRTGKLQVRDAGRGQLVEQPGVEAPYLQLVMKRIWQHELDEKSHRLRRQSLDELGGAATIVQGYLDRVMKTLPLEEREICVRMFQHLVTPSGTKIAHSAVDLAGYADVAPDHMETFLQKIAGPQMRILVQVAPGDAAGEARYEIYHDSLGQAVLDWRRRQIEKKERRELEIERRRTRRLRWLVAALAVVTLVAIGASIFAWDQKKEAKENARRADLSARQASEKTGEAAGLAEQLTTVLAENQDEIEQRKEAEAKNLDLLGKDEEAARLREEVEQSRDQLQNLRQELDNLKRTLPPGEPSLLAERLDELEMERDGALRNVTELEGQLRKVRKEIDRLSKKPDRLEVLEIAELDMRFRPIPAGRFRMGSPEDEEGRESNEARHEVILTRSFWMGETEVTQKQWLELMKKNPSRSNDCDNCPVERVNWYEAVTFANEVSERDGKESCYQITGCSGALGDGCSGEYPLLGCTGDYACDIVVPKVLDCDGYRLPTEAEWEYAARAGTTTPFWTGSNLTADQANSGDALGKTEPVRRSAKNPWGLYGVHGNVSEWTQDWFGAYPGGTVEDPTGPEDGSKHVTRGGDWISDAHSCRAASRDKHSPSHRSENLGFRLVRTLP